MFSQKAVLAGLHEVLPHHQAIKILQAIEAHSSTENGDIRTFLNNLAARAFQLDVLPDTHGTISEQQLVKVLNVSPSFFRTARLNHAATPHATKQGNRYRYNLIDVAEWQLKRHKVSKI